MFFDTYQPFFAKWFTYFSKTIYLLPEKGLPFPPKGSTFSIKKVNLFAEKVDPFSKVALRTKFFPMFVIYDVKENVLGLR